MPSPSLGLKSMTDVLSDQSMQNGQKILDGPIEIASQRENSVGAWPKVSSLRVSIGGVIRWPHPCDPDRL